MVLIYVTCLLNILFSLCSDSNNQKNIVVIKGYEKGSNLLHSVITRCSCDHQVKISVTTSLTLCASLP